jgi:hypothetical protein
MVFSRAGPPEPLRPTVCTQAGYPRVAPVGAAVNDGAPGYPLGEAAALLWRDRSFWLRAVTRKRVPVGLQRPGEQYCQPRSHLRNISSQWLVWGCEYTKGDANSISTASEVCGMTTYIAGIVMPSGSGSTSTD